jgi:hypothetical protein
MRSRYPDLYTPEQPRERNLLRPMRQPERPPMFVNGNFFYELFTKLLLEV